MLRTLLLAASAALLLPAAASAQAIISNGTVQLGVDSLGQLNIPGPASSGGVDYVGLRDVATNRESTAPGCLCEGWGVAVQGTSITGYANNSTGTGGLTLGSFASSATTATSTVSVGSDLSVVHSFTPSSTPYLYQVDVTITNISGADLAGSLLYRRTMDWDIEPTAFSEYSTIQGTTGATNVLGANDNGFCSSNPLDGCSPIIASGDFVDSGPTDHGANFDFIFSPLAAGASQTLTIFYGVAPTETLALSALSSVGAEIYSFGQANGSQRGGQAFIFGFKGVGGVVIPDPGGVVPEPGTWALMIGGFGLAGAALRRQRRLAVA